MNKLKTIDRKAVSWKFLFKIRRVNPLKQFAQHYRIVDQFTPKKFKFNTKSISNRGEFWNFSLAPKEKSIKRPWNIYKNINSLSLKNAIFLAIESKMFLKLQQNLSKQAMRSAVRRKQSWIPQRMISWWKASLPPQKENWAFFWTFSFHFLSLTVYF